MKEWNTPVVEELNIAETENGSIPGVVEKYEHNTDIADFFKGLFDPS